MEQFISGSFNVDFRVSLSIWEALRRPVRRRWTGSCSRTTFFARAGEAGAVGEGGGGGNFAESGCGVVWAPLTSFDP